MNEKTRKQIENLKNQTIGVEIEMNHITREKAAKIAADFFPTLPLNRSKIRKKIYKNGEKQVIIY